MLVWRAPFLWRRGPSFPCGIGVFDESAPSVAGVIDKGVLEQTLAFSRRSAKDGQPYQRRVIMVGLGLRPGQFVSPSVISGQS